MSARSLASLSSDVSSSLARLEASLAARSLASDCSEVSSSLARLEALLPDRIGSGGLFFKRGLGGLTKNVVQRLLYLRGNLVTLMICSTRGGEGSNGSDGRRVCLLEEPINATVAV